MSKTTNTKKSLDGVVASLGELIDLAGRPEEVSREASSVSNWSIGKHLEHLTLSGELTLKGLEQVLSNPGKTPAPRPTLVGRFCLRCGFIPRGRGNAPQGVVPHGMPAQEMHDRLKAVRQGFVELEGSVESLAASEATQPHPVFGDLDASQWLRFTDIHHHHHQKIMRDIARAPSN